MSCPRCTARVKDWEGDDPRCGFNADGTFNTSNWNCATLNELRDRAGDAVWNEDDWVSILRAPEIKKPGGSLLVVFVLLRWYKSRGRTDSVLWWADDGPPTPITLEQAELVLA
ncbi:MAG: hypothetical protein ABW167_07610 [Baekduia sp.]